MALCDPVGGMHGLFRGVLAEHVFADRPPDGFGAGLDERWAAMSRTWSRATAISWRPSSLSPWSREREACALRSRLPGTAARLCEEHGLLLVLDEIATGFGRTGALFACEHAGVSPDVMCVGKALTGGYMTLAATLCTRSVSDAVSAGEGGGLMHGPTFMANPLACRGGAGLARAARRGARRLARACGSDRAGLARGPRAGP